MNIGIKATVTSVRIIFVDTMRANVPISEITPETRLVTVLLTIVSILSISFVNRLISSPVVFVSK